MNMPVVKGAGSARDVPAMRILSAPFVDKVLPNRNGYKKLNFKKGTPISLSLAYYGVQGVFCHPDIELHKEGSDFLKMMVDHKYKWWRAGAGYHSLPTLLGFMLKGLSDRYPFLVVNVLANEGWHLYFLPSDALECNSLQRDINKDEVNIFHSTFGRVETPVSIFHALSGIIDNEGDTKKALLPHYLPPDRIEIISRIMRNISNYVNKPEDLFLLERFYQDIQCYFNDYTRDFIYMVNLPPAAKLLAGLVTGALQSSARFNVPSFSFCMVPRKTIMTLMLYYRDQNLQQKGADAKAECNDGFRRFLDRTKRKQKLVDVPTSKAYFDKELQEGEKALGDYLKRLNTLWTSFSALGFAAEPEWQAREDANRRSSNLKIL